MFIRLEFDRAAARVGELYERTAPTVSNWCDWLASAKDESITLADVHLLATLDNDKPPANYAANMVYHRMTRCGMETTGHAGF